MSSSRQDDWRHSALAVTASSDGSLSEEVSGEAISAWCGESLFEHAAEGAGRPRSPDALQRLDGLLSPNASQRVDGRLPTRGKDRRGRQSRGVRVRGNPGPCRAPMPATGARGGSTRTLPATRTGPRR